MDMAKTLIQLLSQTKSKNRELRALQLDGSKAAATRFGFTFEEASGPGRLLGLIRGTGFGGAEAGRAAASGAGCASSRNCSSVHRVTPLEKRVKSMLAGGVERTATPRSCPR